MNRTILVGRLTRDPDLKYTPNGVAVANFTLAVDRPFAKDEADFINCVTWRKQAENLAQYMKKGSLIGLEGRIQTRNYEGKDGKRVYVTEVVADSIQFLDSHTGTKKQTKEQVYNESIGFGKKFEQDAEPIDNTDLPF